MSACLSNIVEKYSRSILSAIQNTVHQLQSVKADNVLHGIFIYLFIVACTLPDPVKRLKLPHVI